MRINKNSCAPQLTFFFSLWGIFITTKSLLLHFLGDVAFLWDGRLSKLPGVGKQNALRSVENRQLPNQNGPFLRVVGGVVGGVTT